MSDISVKKTIIDGLNRHRSHATALPSTGMTYLLKPALTIVKASLPCHSDMGKWGRGNLWKAVHEAIPLMYGFRKHRSHATHSPA
jgi:hypothetical protein